MKRLMTAAGLLTAGFLLYNMDQTRRPRVRPVTLPSVTRKTDLRITQISDFHNHQTVNPAAICRAVEAHSPHFIAFTGDLISENTKDTSKALALVEALVNTGIPCFYVHGNHEHHNAQKYAFIDAVKALGVTYLNNESVMLEYADVCITGLPWGVTTKQYYAAVKDTEATHVVLCHSPSDILPTGGVHADLILCGHTHGGQVRVPGVGPIIVPTQGFFGKYNKGVYQLNDAILYIDSGLGNTRLDLRTFNPIQFSNITLTAHR